MKLLVISHSCATPINQQFYAQLERETNWEITIVIPSNWKTEYGKTLTPESWADYKGQLLSIPVWLSGKIPLHIYQTTFIRLLSDLKPDFIYVHQEPYAIQTAQIYWANSLTIDKPIAFFTWQNIYKRYPLIFHQIEKFTLNKSTLAFTGSRSAEEVLRKKGFQKNCIMLPSGIDTDIYTDSFQAQTIKETWQKNKDEIVIGYLGRIVAEKGLKTLLKALNKLKKLPWRLVMVGTGEYETEFKKIAKELKIDHKINYLGYVPHTEAPLYLAAFDVLVIPSETQPNWKEQFGRVIIESMACGTPVIGSTSGEIPYLIEATGGGLTFPEGQPEALARQLSKLIKDRNLRSNLARQGNQTVVEKYTNSTIVPGFASAIEKAVAADRK